MFYIDVLPPWKMCSDGAARHNGAGAGVVLYVPEKHILSYSCALTQLCSNNMAEYQVLILGLQMVIEMGIKDLYVYGDSHLVISQLLKEFGMKKDDIIPYHKHALRLLDRLETVKLEHVPRGANKMANALANLAATLAMRAEENNNVSVYRQWVVTPPDGDDEEEVKVMVDN